MSLFKGFVGVLGSFLLGLSLTLLFGVLFLSHFAAQEADMDTILDTTFMLFLQQNPDQVTSALHNDPTLQEFFTQCDAGTLPASDCTLSIDNPYLSSYFFTVKEGFKEQISPLFRSLDPYMEKRALVSLLALVCFLLGSFFLFFSLDYNKYVFTRKLSGKIGFQCLFFFGLVFFVLHLQKQEILSLFQKLLAGAPDILSLFVSTFVLVFLHAVFGIFFYPLLVLSILFLGLWIGLWIRSWNISRKKKKVSL